MIANMKQFFELMMNSTGNNKLTYLLSLKTSIEADSPTMAASPIEKLIKIC